MLTNERFAVVAASAVLFAALALLGQATAVVDPVVSYVAGGIFIVLVGFGANTQYRNIQRARRLAEAEWQRQIEAEAEKAKRERQHAEYQRALEAAAEEERRREAIFPRHSSCTPSRAATITGNAQARRPKPKKTPVVPVVPAEPKPEEVGILVPDWPIPATLKGEE